MTVTAQERFSELVDSGGFLTTRGANFIEALVRQVNENEPLSGAGSPEGVETANPGKQYWDTAGTAGNILYVKKTGTGNTGWILV
jgi:hypothetical protein